MCYTNTLQGTSDFSPIHSILFSDGTGNKIPEQSKDLQTSRSHDEL